MNAIRRILEYYFLQLCGYEGSILRKTILEENKDAFIHHECGNEDKTRYDMASTMLSCIDSSSYGVNDGLHYVDDGMDVKLYREMFQMLFELMCQEQYYNVMMVSKDERSEMRISYNKLWKLLVDKGMSKMELKDAAGISAASIAKLGKGGSITTDMLLKICEVLD